MMNIIRADMYRIVRGKGLYITLVVLLAVIVLQIVGGSNMNAGVNTETIDITSMDMENFDRGSFNIADFFHSPTGVEAPFQVMGATSNILYILLPLIIIISAADFTSGAARNALTSGVSRFKFYCSKLILSCIFCAALLIVYVLFSIIVATIINGFGGPLNMTYVSDVLKVFLPQLLLCLAGACVTHFFVFTFKRSAAAIGINIAFLLLPSVLILILSFISGWFKNLFDYELTSNIGALAKISSMSSGDIIRTLLVGAGYIVLAAFGGFFVFKKAEIR